MDETARYVSELVCGHCAHTGHVTWEGTGDKRRVIEATATLTSSPDGNPVFACAHCGERLQAI